MQIKIHDAYRRIVALCDSDLIGKTFTEGNRQIKIHEHFFKGEERSYEEILELLIDMEKEDATFNIVGKDSVNAALDAGIITKEGIIEIEGIPIALVLM
ncbi:MAG: DUF424 family protein [Candidatus Pacearchaeota archaeon]|jgi:hypothetical protein